MLPKSLALLRMVIRENFSRSSLERVPEPSAAMDDVEQVKAFHAQGGPDGPLVPIYHFNALGISQMAPEGGTVVDLGSGSGQFLAYLAKVRPDLQIIGLDLAPKMVEIGNEFLASEGLQDQVQLKIGDMTQFTHELPARVDVLSSVFALHHLPTLNALQLCIGQLATAVAEKDCAIWLFDHVRPRHPMTPVAFPQIFTPLAPREFNTDSENSLRAAFSYSELRETISASGLQGISGRRACQLPMYQVHWHDSVHPVMSRLKPSPIRPISADAQQDFRRLAGLFPGILRSQERAQVRGQ